MPNLFDYANEISQIVLPDIHVEMTSTQPGPVPLDWSRLAPDPEDDELLRIAESRILLGQMGLSPDSPSPRAQHHRTVESRVLRNVRIGGGRFLSPAECQQLCGCCSV